MRRAGATALALLLIGAGVAALLLSRDVQRWQRSLSTDDVRYRTAPERSDLWQPAQLIPFGAAASLLGTEDDLLYRHALRALRLGHPHEPLYSESDLTTLRGEAQLWLTRIATADPSRQRRSVADNFLGGLALADAAVQDDEEQVTVIERAIASFQTALDEDPDNADAKYNLELALTRLGPAKQRSNPSSRTSGVGKGNRGAGFGRAGSGY
jgi:tetratricopeptide (TPR) repeat protein